MINPGKDFVTDYTILDEAREKLRGKDVTLEEHFKAMDKAFVECFVSNLVRGIEHDALEYEKNKTKGGIDGVIND